jgi:hypothetical protein
VAQHVADAGHPHDPLPQRLVQAVPRHDIGLSAEDRGSAFFDTHQLEQAKLAPLVIEEQVDVGILAGFVARRRAEQIEVFDAKLLQFRLVLLRPGNGFTASDRVVSGSPGIMITPSVAFSRGCARSST